MTREAIRAEQDDADGPAPQLTRVTVTAIQDDTVTVALPGGALVKAPRISGNIYTIGGLGYAFVQEPAVGPVSPTGLGGQRASVENQATNSAIPHATFTDLIWDTVVATGGSSSTSSGSPWIDTKLAGLYEVIAKVAFDGDDSTNAIVRFLVMNSNGIVLDQTAQVGFVNGFGVAQVSIVQMSGSTSDGGHRLKVQAMQTSGTTRNLILAPAAKRSRIFVRHLGSA